MQPASRKGSVPYFSYWQAAAVILLSPWIASIFHAGLDDCFVPFEDSYFSRIKMSYAEGFGEDGRDAKRINLNTYYVHY